MGRRHILVKSRELTVCGLGLVGIELCRPRGEATLIIRPRLDCPICFSALAQNGAQNKIADSLAFFTVDWGACSRQTTECIEKTLPGGCACCSFERAQMAAFAKLDLDMQKLIDLSE